MRSAGYEVPILMYHRGEEHCGNSLCISPAVFASQMKFLKSHGYNVIKLDKLFGGIKEGKKFAHNTVVITFDDCYGSFYTGGFPVLKKYGIPATGFLVTGRIGKSSEYLA